MPKSYFLLEKKVAEQINISQGRGFKVDHGLGIVCNGQPTFKGHFPQLLIFNLPPFLFVFVIILKFALLKRIIREMKYGSYEF